MKSSGSSERGDGPGLHPNGCSLARKVLERTGPGARPPELAGREVVPGFGIEGEFHAGLQAAPAAGRLLGAKGKP